jgi:SOS-response transcriptional repressor LexA
MSFQLTVKRLREDMEQIHFQYSNLLYEKIKLSKNHFHGKKSETIY